MEEAMSEKLSTDMIVDVIEATVRVLVGFGLSRDEALQVMLSQMAAQVSPDVMKIAAKLNADYHKDFEKRIGQVAPTAMMTAPIIRPRLVRLNML